MTERPIGPNRDIVIELAAGLDIVLISADELLIQFGTRSQPSELLRDGDLTGVLGKLAGRLLEGPVPLAELLGEVPAQFQADARAVIDDLMQRGILTESGRHPVQQYLRYTYADEPSLVGSSVTVIGAGPIGARLALSLLQHGVGKMTLLDDRAVDDLWYALLPQSIERSGEDGQRAHAALHNWLVRMGHTSVEYLDAELDSAGIEAAVAGADLTLVAMEQPHFRIAHLVNRFAIRDRKPWLLTTLDGNRGLIGPLFCPVETACYNDYVTLATASAPSPVMARRYRQHVLGRQESSFFPGLPSYADIVAGHASLATVHFLLTGASFAVGRVMVIDFDRMRIDLEDVLKLPRCPVCGTHRSSYRRPFPPDGTIGS